MTWIFRVLVIALPPTVGFVIYRLAKALKVSGAERIAVVPLDAVLHPRRYRPGPAASHEQPEAT